MDPQLALLVQQQQQQQAYYAAALAATTQQDHNSTQGHTYQGQSQGQQSQAQLFALQQSQIEMQLHQIKLANLALQEQILYQHQQRQVTAQQQQQQQQQQHAQAHFNWQQQTAEGADDAQQTRRGALRSLQQARQQRDTSPTTSLSNAASSNLNWQAERLRFSSNAPVTITSGYGSGTGSTPNTYNRIKQPATPVSPLPPPTESASKHHHRKTSSLASSDSVRSSTTISDAGSGYSPNKGPALVLSKPGDDFEEEDEEEDEEDGMSGKHGQDPMSPSLHASMRTMHIMNAAGIAASVSAGSGKSQESNGNCKDQDINASKEAKKNKRHTLILSSSLPAITPPTWTNSSGLATVCDPLRSESETGQQEENCSSDSSSPTSERSEVASFDSIHSTATVATSTSATSPTVATLAEKEGHKQHMEIAPSKDGVGIRRVVTVPVKQLQPQAPLNPAATAFSPSIATGFTPSSAYSSPALETRYPSHHVHSSPLTQQQRNAAVTTPGSHIMRNFSAPPAPSSTSSSSSFGTPSGFITSITILRQPKGPANESELLAKNFAGMIRRKAVGALRLAAFHGGNRTSPATSPVGTDFHKSQGHVGYATSPPIGSSYSHGLVSPTLPASGFAGFGAELAQRALKRRSQQLALGQK